MLPRKIFENLIAICICRLLKLQVAIIVLFQQLFDEIFLNFFLSLIVSHITTVLWGSYKCPPTGGPNFGDASTRHCPPRFRKHAENITIHLQCLHRLSGKDEFVLGKQVLMFDGEKI